MPIQSTLPVEVIENIIDNTSNDRQTLWNLCLCCHALRTRCRIHLFERIRIKTRKQMLSTSDFLDARTWLPPLVRHVTVCTAAGIVPIALFTRLPNLRSWKFAGDFGAQLEESRILILHQHALSGFRHYGINIISLSISFFNFTNCAELGRLLLTFPNIQELSCLGRLRVNSDVPGSSDVLLLHRLTRRLQIRRLTVSLIVVLCFASLSRQSHSLTY